MDNIFQSPMFPLLLMIPVFYLLILRPKQKELKKAEAMLKSLKKDDTILTNAGIYCQIQAIEEDRVKVKMGDANRVELSKSAILKVVADSKENK
jgi:preprotein translocase subunit YajC